jgi:IS5 family transposase
MQQQLSFAQAEFQAKKKVTRRERFLGEMEQVVPWAALLEELRPHDYPKAGQGPGRRPIALERMLRMYFLQQWFTLADEALEDAIYDSQAFRNFLRIDLSRETVPDATTLCGFRHWLEDGELGKALFERINAELTARGLILHKGTVLDATIIAAPPSTKNEAKARDPEMHQTRKGNQWYFGLKAHIGADLHSTAVHSLTVTAANTADVTQTEHLLHGEEQTAHADAGYIGADKRPGMAERDIQWHIAEKRSRVQAIADDALREVTREAERIKAALRARVEHPFHVVKNLFGYRKVRYKGLAKNTNQLHVLFALANLYTLRRPLMA